MSPRPPLHYLLSLVVAAGAALTIVSVPSATGFPVTTRTALHAAVHDMEAGGYYTFVTLLNLVRDRLPDAATTTFLMPSDEHLARVSVPENKVMKFIRMHSIPSALPYDFLRRLPTRTTIPTNYIPYEVEVNNDNIIRQLFLNGKKVVDPGVCGGGTIVCHGIAGVLGGVTDLLPGNGCRPDGAGHPCADAATLEAGADDDHEPPVFLY